MTDIFNTDGNEIETAGAATATAAAADAAGATATNVVPAVAILGFGTAGMNALIGLRTSGYTGPVRVFSNCGPRPYTPIITSYYAGGMKEREQCYPWTQDEVDELDAEVLEHCPVEQLDVRAHVVRTAQGDFPFTKCIIATGSRPMAYGFPQVKGGKYEPLMLRTMEDAERLRAALEAPRCKRLLVSGASMVALKTLEAALNRGVRVTLVGMNPHVLDMNAVSETAERIEDRLRDYGVELRLGMVIQDVEVVESGDGSGGSDSANGSNDARGASGAGAAAARGGTGDARDAIDTSGSGENAGSWQLRVTFSNGDVDVFDEISVSHGMRSNLEFLPESEEEDALAMDRALLVDEHMRTSNPDVYAAGDVAQALELISGEQRIVGIWKTAALQGFCAGATIAAELAGRTPAAADAYEGAFGTNTIVIKDCLFISAGVGRVGPGQRLEVESDDEMTVARIWETVPGDTSGDGGKARGNETRDDGAIAHAGSDMNACSDDDTSDNGANANGEDTIAHADSDTQLRERLVGFNIACDHEEAGSRAYDLGAMLTMRIQADCK